MYWYLSFLRPPPVSTPISTGSITITPQIANDLRTELLFQPTEISYSWQRTVPTPGDLIKGYEKLFWNPPESTYKSVDIPLPLSARPGESWRVCLHVGPYAQRCISEVTTTTPEILSVWSEPINLVRGEPSNSGGTIRGVGAEGKGKKGDSKRGDSKGKGGQGKKEEGKKQGRIMRDWTIGQEKLRVIEQTSFDLDKKIWDSGLALSGWLYRYLNLDNPSKRCEKVFEVLQAGSTRRLVEIGSGTGLVSIALGMALRQRSRTREIETTATDLAIELMDENLRLNGFIPDANESISVNAEVLDWDQPLPSWMNPDQWPDLIIAADVTYNTSSFPALLKTLVSLLKPESGKRPHLLLSYKQRDLAERDLWGMLGDQGIRLNKIDEIQGAEEEGQVEIWFGCAVDKKEEKVGT